MMVRKILILTNNAVLGGASRSLSLMIEHLRQAEIRTIVLAPAGRAWKNWESAGAEVRLWSSPTCSWFVKPLFATYAGEYSFDRIVYILSDLLFLPDRLFQAGRLLGSLVAQEQPEIIFVNTLALFWLAQTLRKITKIRNTKVFWQIREVLNPKLPKLVFNRIARTITSASSKVIAITSNEAMAFENFCTVEILHNPIPLDWPDDVPQREPHKPAVVAMTGAYRPSKGIQEYFAMTGIVRRVYPDTIFLLFAPHPILPTLRKFLRIFRPFLSVLSEKLFLSSDLLEHMTELTYDNTIQLIFDQDLKWNNYLQMDIYVRSDRSGSPWGRDIIEAMWSGLPVVATGSNEEFIKNGITGFLVDPGKPGSLAQSVLKLLGDRNLYHRMSVSSAERARLLFDKQKYYDRLISWFKI
jgi:glycosyltransferase involved in cell wall biosynthesis